jgi:nucleotide-binding universal stress UspA family protein
MKILVATDFSPAAETATQTAVLLAARLGGSMVLVRAVEPPAILYPEMAGAEIEGMEMALQRGVRAQLSQVATRVREELAAAGADISVEEEIRFGFPEQVLAEYARNEAVDLLLMGAHGRRPVSRLLLGSVTERTMMDSPCPVLVVREGDTPFAAWVQGQRPLRLMVGVDPSPSTDAAISWLCQLRQVAPCDVLLVHHYWPPREYARLGLHGPRDLFETDPEVAATLERDITRRVGTLPGSGSTAIRVRAGWGRLGEALAEQAASEKVDLLIMGSHQPHGWERITRGSAAVVALRSARVPLLCVPEALRPAEATAASASVPLLRLVLAATDFSETGNRAVAHACSLLRGGGVLELCHVRERKLPSPIYSYEATTEALSDADRAEIEGRLRALVPGEAAALGIEVRVTAVDGGHPAEAILQTARRLGADTICLASHGRTGARRVVLGSVAEQVVLGAERPVYVVRGQA